MSNATSVWLVQGSTGEYEDRATWTVTWRMTREDAKGVLVVLCRERAEYLDKFRDSLDRYSNEHADYKNQMCDPHFYCDYTGTFYRLVEVSDDPRADVTDTNWV